MTIFNTTISVDDFIAYAEQHTDQLFELINGRLVEKVTTEEHGYIVINIGSSLKLWLKSAPVSGYYSTEALYQLPSNATSVLRPDVSFHVTNGAIGKLGVVTEMPDFVVEVKSPNNTYQELRDKANLYLANGSRLVWLVYPVKQIIEVYYADTSSELFTKSDTLDGGNVLPDFQMTVSEIFD